MNAGILNEIIWICHPIVEIDDYGNQHTSYSADYKTRASVSHDGGQRKDENNEVIYEYTKEFKMRRYVPISDFDRIKWNDKYWRILQIEQNKPLQQITAYTELVNE